MPDPPDFSASEFPLERLGESNADKLKDLEILGGSDFGGSAAVLFKPRTIVSLEQNQI